jgi:hypothetical protein
LVEHVADKEDSLPLHWQSPNRCTLLRNEAAEAAVSLQGFQQDVYPFSVSYP